MRQEQEAEGRSRGAEKQRFDHFFGHGQQKGRRRTYPFKLHRLRTDFMTYADEPLV